MFLLLRVLIHIVRIAPQRVVFDEAEGKRNRTEQTFVPSTLCREDRFYLLGIHDSHEHKDFADADCGRTV